MSTAVAACRRAGHDRGVGGNLGAVAAGRPVGERRRRVTSGSVPRLDLLDHRGGGHLPVASVGAGTELRPGTLQRIPQHQVCEPAFPYDRERQPALLRRQGAALVGGQTADPFQVPRGPQVQVSEGDPMLVSAIWVTRTSFSSGRTGTPEFGARLVRRMQEDRAPAGALRWFLRCHRRLTTGVVRRTHRRPSRCSTASCSWGEGACGHGGPPIRARRAVRRPGAGGRWWRTRARCETGAGSCGRWRGDRGVRAGGW